MSMKSKSSSKNEMTSQPPAGEELSQNKPAASISARTVPSFKQILVPIDFSDCSASALNYALALGEKFGAKVTLLHVVEPAVYPENYLITPSTLDEANQNLINAGRERLAKMQGRFVTRGVALETLVRMGRAQSEISDTAKAIASDLIVMGTHGHSGLKHALLGGTAERVVGQAPCPVLTVREQ